VFAVLKDVEVARVVGCVDDALEICAAGKTAVAAALAVDADGGGLGAESQNGGEEGVGEVHGGWLFRNGDVQKAGEVRMWLGVEVRVAVSWWI